MYIIRLNFKFTLKIKLTPKFMHLEVNNPIYLYDLNNATKHILIHPLY